MKWTLPLTFLTLLFSGCQNFRYYDPSKPHHAKNQFLNNYSNPPKPSFLKWQWERLTSSSPTEPPFNPEIVKTDTAFLKANHKETTLTWIGHATSLLQLQGLNILMDPVFSERVSPFSFIGPKRLVALPFSLEELPPIDLVVISHGHYDHLDIETLKRLSKKDQGRILFLVPLGSKALLNSAGIENVQELDWWDEVSLKSLKITFVPSQHWSARGIFDQNQTLWGGWHIRAPEFKLIFVGDTAYSKDFSDIHDKLGDVDLALIPIGAYEPRWFMKTQHVNPEESVQIHKDLHAKLSIGVHWGTFRLADEPMNKPAEDLHTVLKESKTPLDFRLLKHGEVFIPPSANREQK